MHNYFEQEHAINDEDILGDVTMDVHSHGSDSDHQSDFNMEDEDLEFFEDETHEGAEDNTHNTSTESTTDNFSTDHEEQTQVSNIYIIFLHSFKGK